MEVEGEGENAVLEIEICAINTNPLTKTIKVAGFTKRKKFSILFDSGSNYSFIDQRFVKLSGNVISVAKPMMICVADGSKVISEGMCKEFSWSMHGEVYSYDLRVIELGTVDCMLGVDWMLQFDSVKFQYKKRRVVIKYRGRKLVFEDKGETVFENEDKLATHLLEGEELGRMFSSGQVAWVATMDGVMHEEGLAEKCELGFCEGSDEKESGPGGRKDGGDQSEVAVSNFSNNFTNLLKVLCERFKVIFEDQKGLRPKRACDHQIPLVDGTKPVEI